MIEGPPLPQGEGRGEGARARGLPPNNFDLLRLALALLVLFSHAFVLSGRPDQEPVARLLFHVTDGGGAAVGAFFVLSGYLITRSAERHPWPTYLRARALRILPAFVVLTFIQVLILGPALSSLGPAAYLTRPETWFALLRTLLFSPPPGLPGVFEHNPLPGIVNGSLWTLRLELVCYAATLVWALLGQNRWVVALALLAISLALTAAVALGASLRTLAVLECLLYFATGATFWLWRETKPFQLWIVLASALLFLATTGTNWATLTWQLLLPALVLRLAFTPPILQRPLAALGDISYGTYLYAFPVTQALAAAIPGIGPYALAAAATPPTLFLAFASSRLVERPTLALRPALDASSHP